MIWQVGTHDALARVELDAFTDALTETVKWIKNRYPAVDVSASLSRLFPRVSDPAQRAAAGRVRAWLAKHAEIEFMLQIGEYKPGGDAAADEAIARMPRIEALLRQGPDERAHPALTLQALAETAA